MPSVYWTKALYVLHSIFVSISDSKMSHIFDRYLYVSDGSGIKMSGFGRVRVFRGRVRAGSNYGRLTVKALSFPVNCL